MIVVLAEKPSVARDIARVLKAEKKANGYYVGNNYAVSWAIGHLVRLGDPVKYNDTYKRWNIADLPIIPEKFITEVGGDAGIQRQFETIKTLFLSDDTTEIVCATDAGREGELIFRYIYDLVECDKPIKRLWISSQTDQALTEGFASLKDGKEYDTLYDSAKSRSESDWLIGINATRAYTLRYGQQKGVMSVGRVQTPVLNMIVNRYREFKDFKPKTYYEISAIVVHENGKYKARLDIPVEKRIFEKGTAQGILEEIQQNPEGKIKVVKKKAKTEKQPLLYDLTEIQKDANKKFKFSADKTLKLVQALYETHKIVTYPRTSSRYLSNDLKPKIKGLISNLSHIEAYAPFVEAILQKPIKTTKRVFDDKKVTDHHALIPTDKKANPKSLSADEEKIYDLVMRRFLAAFMDECKKSLTDIQSQFGKHVFISKGSVIDKAGWRDVYLHEKKGGAEEEQLLPPVEKGDPITNEELKLEERKTKAPQLYTEASILAAMETAGKNIDDEDMREAMKDCGLGTPATRAQILERLITVQYIVREKNKLIPTEKGEQLIDCIHNDELTSPELTGQFEKKLNDMRLGQYERDSFMREIEDFAREVIDNVKFTHKQKDGAAKSKKAYEDPGIGKCPSCEGFIIEGKKGFGCSNWRDEGCKFVIWKVVAQKELELDHVKALLESGKTEKITGFVSKKGNKFDTVLKLDEEKKVVFDFS